MIRSTHRPTRVGVVAIALVVALAVTAGPGSRSVVAQTIDWGNSTGGVFAEGVNWLGGLTPGMTESARFALPDMYSVDFAGAGATNVDLLVTGGDVELMSTVDMPTYSLTGTTTIAGSLSLSSVELATGDVLIDGGRLTANVGSALTLGVLGQLTVQDAGRLDMAVDLELLGATVVVDGAGTMLNIAGADLNLTNGSQVSVTNDATVSVDRLRALSGGLGVSGRGHIAANETTVGADGSAGVINLLDGAAADLGTTNIAVSDTTGTDGSVNVETGAVATADDVAIATEGLIGQSGQLRVGGQFTQNGAATLTLGTASQVGTDAQLRIDAGGHVTTGTGALTVNQTGTITNDGGTLSVLGDLVVDGGVYEETDEAAALVLGTGSTWTIQNGGRATYLPEGSLSLGADTALVVDGIAAIVENLDDVQVGTTVGATARLAVQNSASLSLADVSLSGLVNGSDARLDVHSGSTLIVSEQLDVASAGLAATASVDIDGDDSLLDYDGTAPLRVGAATGGPAELSISDTATLDLGNQDLHIGATGTVRLNNGQLIPGGDILVDGGRLEQTAADMAELEMLGSGGALRIVDGGSADLVQDLSVDDTAIQVDAAGSTLNVAGDVLIVSDNVSGAGLVAANQAAVRVQTLDLGNSAAPDDSATARVLSGAAVAADTIRVGDPEGLGVAATANLEVGGGGSGVELNPGGAMTIGANAGTLSNQGVVDLVDGGTLDTSVGTLAVRSSGVLNIDGGTLTTAPIATQQGLVQFSGGTIDWRGDFAVGVAGAARN